MNAENFRWDNSVRATYVSIPWLWNFDEDKPMPEAELIGYCDSAKVKVLPKPGYYAIMFYFEGENVWFHLDAEAFKRYKQKISG